MKIYKLKFLFKKLIKIQQVFFLSSIYNTLHQPLIINTF